LCTEYEWVCPRGRFSQSQPRISSPELERAIDEKIQEFERDMDQGNKMLGQVSLAISVFFLLPFVVWEISLFILDGLLASGFSSR